MKIKESQLRSIIRNTLNEMMDEGRPRIKPSYWEIEDYKQVPGAELYVPDTLKMKHPQFRDPEKLKNAFLLYHAIYATVDEQGGVRAYFYHYGNEFVEGPDAWDEDAWYECMDEGSMKGRAKQTKVLLYQHVPNFEKIWEDARKWTANYRNAEADQEERTFGKGERATVYNTVPTIHGSGGMVNETKSVKLNESKLREIIRETLNEMINTKKLF